jgi:hypothetical protein
MIIAETLARSFERWGVSGTGESTAIIILQALEDEGFEVKRKKTEDSATPEVL